MTEPSRLDFPDVWLHEPRGGYGYTLRIPCCVTAETEKRLLIKVMRTDGTIAYRNVTPERVERDARLF